MFVKFSKELEYKRILQPRQHTTPRFDEQEKMSCCSVEVAVLSDPCEKIKESQNIDKYLDLARELNKM